MKIGLFGINLGLCSYPAGLTRVARLAEELGYDSLWAGEHMVLPSPRVPPSPMEPTDRMLDPLCALTFAAAATSTILLSTGVLLLPQRNPVALAKEAASLDVLSEGRLQLGVGVGYLEQEFAAVGAPMADRGSRTAEYLAAMRALWTQPEPTFHGRYVSFDGVDAHPRPVRGDIPIVMGGRSVPAHRRAVADSLGWYGFMLDPDATSQNLAGLRKAAEEVKRRADLPALEVSVSPPGLKPGWFERYAELGVDRIVLAMPTNRTMPEIEDWLARRAPATADAPA
ncbi:LLM class F420-dependent oxidoreductase [Parafrankia elaeagni]|uniref:LLM class F420-dependent oxidoreductase n=1 Tax=Parafrankia elaeagni TaxID=222534 RepID=UPI001E430CC2|nr:LLM class F420-dependent oxidoreductase [Parafrankia elaeagni]